MLRDGGTGLLCQTDDDMVEAVQWVATLDRTTYRQEFEQRFTVEYDVLMPFVSHFCTNYLLQCHINEVEESSFQEVGAE